MNVQCVAWQYDICQKLTVDFNRATTFKLSSSEWTDNVSDKGGCPKKSFFWDFVPNIGPHPPTAQVWDSTKWKIKVKFILLFRLFRAFYFFEKMRNFSDKIPKFQNLWGLKASWNGQIWPPHLCITCFRTFLDVCSKNNWMVIFTKKFGTLDPHLPIVWDKVPKKTFFLDTFPKLIIRLTVIN